MQKSHSLCLSLKKQERETACLKGMGSTCGSEPAFSHLSKEGRQIFKVSSAGRARIEPLTTD